MTIAEALRRLPVLPDRVAEIEAEANQLGIMHALSSLQDAPGHRRSGTAKAARELRALAETLAAVAEQLGALPAEARTALDAQLAVAKQERAAAEAKGTYRRSDRVPHPALFDISALALARTALAAEAVLLAGPRHGAARPRKEAAYRVSVRAVGAYERLTGLTATIGTGWRDHRAKGQFLAFIADLFAAMGINASPEAQARAAIAAAKEKRSLEKST